MAGSRKTVAYTSDSGDQYCISVDESNVELVMGASVPANASFPSRPSGLKIRKVRLFSELGLVQRVVPVLTLARFTELTGATALTTGLGDPDSGTAVRVRNKIPERITFVPRDYDTAKTDGDST